MIPVIILLFCYWASAGAVASVKAARTSSAQRKTTNGSPGAAASSATSPNPALPSAGRPRMANSDVTFGDWQRAAYSRWKGKIRSATFGKHRGSKAADVLGDSLAAALAGAAVFGSGFATGTAWAGTRWAQRNARQRLRTRPTEPRKSAAPKPNDRPGPDRDADDKDRANGFNPGAGPSPGGQDRWDEEEDDWSETPRRRPAPDDDVLDFEIVDDPNVKSLSGSRYANPEDAELINVPELLAYYPNASNGATMADEIQNIHVLFNFAKTVIIQGSEFASEAQIRKNSAIERADQASVRSGSSGARAERSVVAATTTAQQISQLEETAARFSGLNMDSASLASITTAIEAGMALVRAEQIRAEAEAIVAADAATLAASEAEAAVASDGSSKTALVYVEAVQNMHDTVQLHQMPHAEAQAATGNAAAHKSVLAAG